MPTDQTLIKNNLKFLKIDIWVHSVLLALGVLIPVCLFISSLLPFVEGKDKGWFAFRAIYFLLLSGIIGITWQIISWFIHLIFKENHTSRTKLIRKIVIFYYLIILFVFTSLFSIYAVYPIKLDLIPSNIDYYTGIIVFSIILISPIFWLIYYINLFSQRKNLKMISVENGSDILKP